MSRSLVVGAGYVGSQLLRRLSEGSQSGEVLGLRRSEDDSDPQIVGCDISDADSVRRLTNAHGRFDCIVHCASSGRGGLEAYRQVFLHGTQNLLDILSPDRFVFVSSTSVYPQLDGSVITEESESRGSRPTSEILCEAERLVLGSGGSVARLSGIYGPSRSVILKRFLLGEAKIDAGGLAANLQYGRLLNQIHRDDAASGLEQILFSECARGEVYNVSDRRPLTQVACYQALAERFGLPMPGTAEPDPERKRAWTHKAIDSSKLQALGWDPIYSDYITAIENDPELVPSIKDQVT